MLGKKISFVLKKNKKSVWSACFFQLPFQNFPKWFPSFELNFFIRVILPRNMRIITPQDGKYRAFSLFQKC